MQACAGEDAHQGCDAEEDVERLAKVSLAMQYLFGIRAGEYLEFCEKIERPPAGIEEVMAEMDEGGGKEEEDGQDGFEQEEDWVEDVIQH